MYNAPIQGIFVHSKAAASRIRLNEWNVYIGMDSNRGMCTTYNIQTTVNVLAIAMNSQKKMQDNETNQKQEKEEKEENKTNLWIRWFQVA